MTGLPENIARVFPRRTKWTPTDENVYIGKPKDSLLIYSKHYKAIHISVTFTWDVKQAHQLVQEWSNYGRRILVGGPAISGIIHNIYANDSFTPGMYIKKGIVFTSRGCPNHCWYCLVPKWEGELRELPITDGHIIQDNNLLACSEKHIRAVFEMLKGQHRIEFAGGLQADLITEWIAQELSRLNIRHLWLSYDRPVDPIKISRAVSILNKFGFKRDQIRCYVLIGYEGDTLLKASIRLMHAWSLGTLPFAMRYRKPEKNFADSFVYTDRSWNELTTKWSRPKRLRR